MEVRVFGSPRELNDDELRGHSAVVIDVLRSSATITTALLNGAREIIPVATPAQAAEIAARTGRHAVLLAGERDGKMIEGFDLSNSPPEFTHAAVNGRTIVFSSTNGAPLIVRCKSADHVYIGCFNNYSSVLRQLIGDRKHVSLLCAGKHDQFCLEDFAFAGKLVEGLEDALEGGVSFSDSARAAKWLYRHHAHDMPALMRLCSHGAYLASIGYAADLDYCARVDTHPIVPTWVEGKVKGIRPHAVQGDHRRTL